MFHTYCPKSELIVAVWKNDLNTVKTLLSNGFDVNTKDSEGRTALLIASLSGYKAMVQLILEYKPDINSQSADGWTALHYAVLEGDPEITEILLRNKADPQIKNHEKGYNALEWAILFNLYEIVQLLIEHGAQVFDEHVKGMVSLLNYENRNKYYDLLELH